MASDKSLEVVSSLNDIPRAVDMMVTEGVPGFQISPELANGQLVLSAINPDDAKGREILDVIQTAVRQHLPHFCLSELMIKNEDGYRDIWGPGPQSPRHYGTLASGSLGDEGAHIDGDATREGMPLNNSGVAVHTNHGLGHVTLRSARMGAECTYPPVGEDQQEWMERTGTGDFYHGELADGTTTVFSEGIMSDHLTPAIHRFSSGEGGLRTWERCVHVSRMAYYGSLLDK